MDGFLRELRGSFKQGDISSYSDSTAVPELMIQALLSRAAQLIMVQQQQYHRRRDGPTGVGRGGDIYKSHV